MKTLFVFSLAIALSSSAKAQFIFRNTDTDTFWIAVGMFETTASKDITSQGWYRINPGDSLVIGAVVGPAVYYFDGKCNVLPEKSDNPKEAYREFLYLTGSIKDKTKFTIKHANHLGSYEHYGRGYAMNHFRVVLIPEAARRAGRMVIVLNCRGMRG